MLNPGCCFCFLKQAHTPLLLKELRATICLGWELFSGKFGDYLWTQIIYKFVGNRPSSWDKLSSSSTIKDLPASVWKQIRPTEQQVPTCTPCQLAVHLLKHIASNSLHVRSLWALSPSLYPFLFSISTSLPFHPLIGVPEPQRGGERGHGVKVFSSLDLGACWERLGERMAALELGLGGQDFNSVKEQLVWVFLHVALPSLSPQIQGDEKFVQMGTSKIKKVYGPKPLSLPCSSIREECNNVSIWPQLDWLKTRKSFLCFGVLTAGWNLIKKLKNFWGIFHIWDQRNSPPRVSVFLRNY